MICTTLRHVLAAALIAAAVPFAAMSGAAAEPLPPAVIAVIDSKLIFEASDAGKDIAAQVEEIRANYQSDIDKKQADLRAEEDEIKRQETILSPEAYEIKQREFRRKVVGVQNQVQQTTRMIEQAVRRAELEVQRTIATILAEMQNEYGFNIVLDKSQVWVNVTTLELNDEVLERLNKRLPKMPVQLKAQ